MKLFGIVYVHKRSKQEINYELHFTLFEFITNRKLYKWKTWKKSK